MRTIAVLLAVLVLSGCGSRVPNQPGGLPGTPGDPMDLGPTTAGVTEGAPPPTVGPTDADPGATPDAEPGGDPATQPPTDGGGTGGGAPQPGPGAPPASPAPAPTPTTTAGAPGAQPGSPTPGPFRTVGVSSDQQGDAGIEGPAYADIRQVTIEDNGPTARVTVHVAGTIPTTLAGGEVMGIGVDVYARAGGESDFQLFISGNADGWEAFLQNVNGLYEHPGPFAVADRQFAFELDWAHLGQLPEGGFRAFIDWSRQRVPVNATGGDTAPNRGTSPFRR